LESDSEVTVSTETWLVFEPVSPANATGFIIYPGGRVDPRSYAPTAHAIAAEGYLTVIVPMPLNLAVFGANKANDIISAHPEIDSWAIGGHSLGGSMAAQFTRDNPSKINGLVLWAAYPPSGTDLSSLSILVTTIHGTNDGLVTDQQIQDSLKLLPSTAVRVEISGGNHAQFGYYGDQPGDKPATISREMQQVQIITSTAQLLGAL
jgi:dienelactone hydrolase